MLDRFFCFQLGSKASKQPEMQRINRLTKITRLGKPLGFARKYSTRLAGYQHATKAYRTNAVVAAVSVASILGGLYLSNAVESDDKVDSVSVISSVDPIPMKVNKPLSTEFDLIGYGIREVSFLKFQVYAFGLYVANEDVPLVKKILNSKFIESFYEDIAESANENDEIHKANLLRALQDQKVSNVLARNLLSSGVRFTARICAIRNTDLSHLRDGFIRTIRNNPNYSRLMKSDDESIGERITQGLDDLRDIFNSVKMSAKKNSLVYMEIDENQNIKVTVETFSKSSPGATERNPPMVLGTVKEPLITELLFESYLGAEKPLIKDVQRIAAESIVSCC